MVDDGVTVVCGTPHVRDDYPTSAETMEAALASVREAVVAAGIPVGVRGGGEIALDAAQVVAADERSRFGLGGNPRLLLLEFPYVGWPMGLAHICVRTRLAARGGCRGASDDGRLHGPPQKLHRQGSAPGYFGQRGFEHCSEPAGPGYKLEIS